MEQETKIEWENTKDELYTYFGRCSSCDENCVVIGSKYCPSCGKLVINPLRATPTTNEVQ